jgi:hypothetical protein
MNKTEAIRVQTLVRWLLAITDDGLPPVTADGAGYALAELAGRAKEALSTGVSRSTVENRWDELAPALVGGHRWVLPLNPPDVRAWFERQGCEECADGDTSHHRCDRQRVAALTDHQLDLAAARLVSRGAVLDTATDDAMWWLLDYAETQPAEPHESGVA